MIKELNLLELNSPVYEVALKVNELVNAHNTELAATTANSDYAAALSKISNQCSNYDDRQPHKENVAPAQYHVEKIGVHERGRGYATEIGTVRGKYE